MRKVLVATDGSPHSLRILPHAEAFARRSGATVHQVRILPPEAAEPSGTEGQTRPEVHRRTRSESLAEAIPRVAADMGADLIAMHSEHAFSSVHHVTAGSVTLDVLARTNLPLLVSGPSIGEVPPDSRRFIVGTDGTAASDQALVRQANWLTERAFDVTLLEVYLPRLGDDNSEREGAQAVEERLNNLKQSLAQGSADIAVAEVPNSRQIEPRIVKVAQEANACGIAVSTAAHRRLRHLMLGSVSMAILRQSPLPLLLTLRSTSN